MKRTLHRALAVAALAAASLWLARAGAAPTVTFEIDPPNPVAGQTVVLRDTSPAAATSWLWDFGDGSSAATAAPSHVWSAAGPYTVRLTSQDTSTATAVTVSSSTTLRLLGVHPFEISIDAKDPNTGADSPAQAVAVTDRFGWFSFPGITHDPGNPEVTLKVLEATTFGHYWIFWSAMTSLHYTMTVRDVTTGQVQVYEKTDDSPCGNWDTETFPILPTPTPAAPTATAIPGQPTRTRTPTPTRTPTGAATVAPTVTPTATPSGPTQLGLRVLSWQWDWCSVDVPCQQGTCAYQVENPDPMGLGRNGITLHEGCTYQLTIRNVDSSGGDQTQPHELNAGLVGLGIPDTVLTQGQSVTYTLTIPTSGPANVGFACKNTSCGNANQHEGMLGVIHIVP